MCYRVLPCGAVSCIMMQCVAVCCSVLQCVAVCCSVLQCVAVCCSVLQCIAVCCSASAPTSNTSETEPLSSSRSVTNEKSEADGTLAEFAHAACCAAATHASCSLGMSTADVSHVTRVNTSCCKRECVLRNVRMSHVTRVNTS